MPPVLLSTLPSPQFRRADFLSGRYAVTRISRSGTDFQLIQAFDVESSHLKIIKVLSRRLITDRKILSSLRWLRCRRTADGRHSTLSDSFNTSSFWFFVFDFPSFTLREVLDRDDLRPLQRRQVRDISIQIIHAVRSLHRSGILHSDISPDSVEILSMNTVTLSVCDQEGQFHDKTILQSTKIRLVFFGGAGAHTDPCIGTDQYRAPEIVFGWISKFRSDNFSIGCVIWEMVVNCPLFFPCERGLQYAKEKAHQFVARLGDFPDSMVTRIKRVRDDIFVGSSSELTDAGELTHAVQVLLREAEIISTVITEEEVLEVIEKLTELSPSTRICLSDVVDYPFFARVA